MAKSNREIVAMVCTVCKSQNYTTTRNKVNMQVKNPEGSSKLLMSKFCKICRKHQPHRESSKLK